MTVLFQWLWQDLQSTNLVEVCMALTIVSQIFPREMIPAVLPLIEDKLQHSKYVFIYRISSGLVRLKGLILWVVLVNWCFFLSWSF